MALLSYLKWADKAEFSVLQQKRTIYTFCFQVTLQFNVIKWVG